MFYPRVVAIRLSKYVVNKWGPNVAISLRTALDTDVELPDTQSRVTYTLEMKT